MSVGYVAIQWNRHKRIYDLVVVASIVLFLAAFFVAGKLAYRGAESISDEVLLLRALGACAYALLHVVLCIGPLARLDRRFAPILYNRRHLGVAAAAVATLHGIIALGYYHGFGLQNPLVSLLTNNTNFASLTAFPYQILGAAALVVLLLMAATSHDFWLKNLGQKFWKRIHMLVYVAYALVVMHVALGALQAQRSSLLALLVLVGAAVVCGLHLVAGLSEYTRDRRSAAPARVQRPTTEPPNAGAINWINAGVAAEMIENRAKIVCGRDGERIAVFRYEGKLSAITNVCAHQGGPLGEGKIIDGCVTCPWHGWQYRPGDGQSPPPFTEKIPTFRVRVEGRNVWIDPSPLPPGTAVPPVIVQEH